MAEDIRYRYEKTTFIDQTENQSGTLLTKEILDKIDQGVFNAIELLTEHDARIIEAKNATEKIIGIKSITIEKIDD